MRIILLFLVSFFPLYGIAAYGAPPLHCTTTPKIAFSHSYPGRDTIVPSNKLALPAGKSSYPNGEIVYLSGRVLDENCVPMSDAVIDIWQADPEGKYVTRTLGDRMNPYPVFTGSGRAVSDNLGRFNFVTLFPGAYDKRAPHINVHVIHTSFPALETEMFFLNDWRNRNDEKLVKLPVDSQTLLMAKVSKRRDKSAIDATWDIILPGKDAYHHF